ncbi:MAG: hypothetical protein SGBAC_009358 [Bacillariaceae sp.]
MAGTRLWISVIILAELIILALLSLYYGLCVLNDDYLCHALDDQKSNPGTLRPLPRPSWWSTALHIHLVVEESQSLHKWSQQLEEWMKTSEVEDLPYFGSTQIHMQVVPKSNNKLWEMTEGKSMNLLKNSSVWSNFPERQSNSMAADGKILDWMLFVPSKQHLEQLSDEVPPWLAWKRGSEQLVTVLTTKSYVASDMTPLTSLIGSWLEKSADSEVTPQDLSENDYLRKLQFTWQKAIMQDFDAWKVHLTSAERKDVFLGLGKTSQSFSARFQELLQVRAILEAVMERNKAKDILTPEFPLEHYAAVFLPLLFPLLMPFMTAFVKELKRFKKKVKTKHEKAKAAKQATVSESDDSKED